MPFWPELFPPQPPVMFGVAQPCHSAALVLFLSVYEGINENFRGRKIRSAALLDENVDEVRQAARSELCLETSLVLKPCTKHWKIHR